MTALTGEADIAVIVPTRNRVALLRRLVDALVAISDRHTYEIVVVDEGSSDGTPAYLVEMERIHGVKVVRHDVPRGLPGARNAGFDASNARYVAWIDDDDLTAPDRLARQLEALESSPSRWSCAARVDIDDSLEVIGYFECPSGPVLDQLLASNVLPSAAQGLLVERELFEEAGRYDEELDAAEDWEYAIRLAAINEPHLLDEPLVGYRTGVASMSTDTARMERAISEVLQRHSTLAASRGVRPDWGAIHQSLLAADLMAGRRPALQRALKAFRCSPSVPALRRVVLSATMPRQFARRSAARRASAVPASWRRQAHEWLDAYEVVPDEHGGERSHPASGWSAFGALWRSDVHRIDGTSGTKELVSALRRGRNFRPIFLARACQTYPAPANPLGAKLLRRAHRWATDRAGVDFPWETSVGPGLSLVHGWGTVVNPGAVIGSNVTIFHGVTIGRKDDIADADGARSVGGAPTIGDGVWIGPHAILIGPITVGDGARIGGGSVVTSDVPAGALVVGNPAVVIREDVAPDTPNPAPLHGFG